VNAGAASISSVSASVSLRCFAAQVESLRPSGSRQSRKDLVGKYAHHAGANDFLLLARQPAGARASFALSADLVGLGNIGGS
jgi:hypothetical protein